MKTLLNIGHSRQGTSDLWSQDIVTAVKALGVHVVRFELVNSHTEPTTFLEVDTLTLPKDTSLEFLSKFLEQDCIAIYDEDRQEGRLVGPGARIWGPFNPDFFITPEGPLSARQEASR